MVVLSAWNAADEKGTPVRMVSQERISLGVKAAAPWTVRSRTTAAGFDCTGDTPTTSVASTSVTNSHPPAGRTCRRAVLLTSVTHPAPHFPDGCFQAIVAETRLVNEHE